MIQTNRAWLYISLLLCCCLASQKEVDLTDDKPFSESSSLSAADSNIYQLNTKDISPDNVLSILVSGSSNTINLTISAQQKTWPAISSKDQRKAFCIINDSNTYNSLQLTVSCKQTCNYSLTLRPRSWLSSNLTESFRIQNFDTPSLLLLKGTVPQLNTEYSELVFELTKYNYDTDEKIEVFAYVGKFDPTAQYQWKGTELTDYTTGIVIKNNKHVTQGDEVFVVGIIPARITWGFNSFPVYNSFKKINFWQNISEKIMESTERLYHLDLQDYQQMMSSNGTFILRLTRISGSCSVLISGSEGFEDGKTILAVSAFSPVTQYTLTDKKRRRLNITNQLFMKVFIIDQATFTMFWDTNFHFFSLIYDSVSQTLSIQNDQTSNIIYTYHLPTSTPPNITLDLFLTSPTNSTDFVISRCLSIQTQQVDDPYSCFPRQRPDQQQLKKMDLVKGRYHQGRGMQFYRFSYDTNQCTKKDGEVVCDFLVTIWRQPGYESQTVDLEVEMKESSLLQDMFEGFPSRAFVSKDQYSKFIFSMVSLVNVRQVRFYLTTLSGECTMHVSETYTNGFEFGQGAVGDSISITSDISPRYYIAIRGYEESYFMVTALVVRKSKETQSAPAKIGAVLLIEGVAHTFTIEQGSHQAMKFGIKLPSVLDFTVSIIGLEGSFWSEIVPVFSNQTPIGNALHLNGSIFTINHKQIKYSADNEFLVTVHSVMEPTTFTIVYHIPKSDFDCSTFMVGRPIVLKPSSQPSHCFSFHITKLDQLQIILDSQIQAQQVEAHFSIGINKLTISDRYTRVTVRQLKQLCPDINNKDSDIETCNLIVAVGAVRKQLTIVVQYTKTDILLYDGLMHRVRNLLSNTTGRHFYFNLANDHSVSVFLRSRTHTDYIMIAALLNWTDYQRESDPFPKNTANESAFVSTTTQTGITALVIPSDSIKTTNCSSCVLVITVFKKGQQKQVDFKIQVSQSLTKLVGGSSTPGYVQKGSQMLYQITNEPNQQAVVTLSSLHQDCAHMQIYSRSSNSKELSKVSSKTNHFILEKSTIEKVYRVNVIGKATCVYHISLGRIDQRVYEVYSGVPTEVQLKKGEKTHFLYFHNRNQSFRLISAEESGSVTLQAQPLKISQSSGSYDNQLSKPHLTFKTLKQSKTLTIDKRKNNYCFDCYYLLRVESPKSASKTSLLIHNRQSSVALRMMRSHHQTLRPNDYEQYSYSSPQTFNIKIDVIAGVAKVTVVRGQEKVQVVKPQVISKESVITVEHGQGKKRVVNGYDSENQFVIKVEAVGEEKLNFFVEIQNSTQVTNQMRVGAPHGLTVSGKELCLTYRSSSANANLIALLASEDDLTSVKYKVTLNGEHNKVQTTEQRGNDTLRIDIQSVVGEYSFCFSNQQEVAGTIVLLNQQNANNLGFNTQKIIEANGEVQSITIEEPGWLVFQVFPCGQQVNVYGSRFFSDIIEKNNEAKFQHQIMAGHLIQNIQVSKGIYFFGIQPRQQQTSTPKQHAMVKASFYPKQSFPYDSFQIPEDGLILVNIDPKTDQVDITLKSVEQISSNYTIVSQKYTVYVSSDPEIAKAASQCENQHSYLKSVVYNFEEAVAPEKVSFHVTKDEIEDNDLSSDQLFITAVCTMHIKLDNNSASQELKFIYGETQVNYGGLFLTKKVIIAVAATSLIVALLIILIARKFCYRKVIVAETKFTEQPDPIQHAQGPLFTEQALPTQGIIVTGGTNSTFPGCLTDAKMDERPNEEA